jgi:cysteine desulfurase
MQSSVPSVNLPKAEKYFDYAATTPLDPRVLDAMLPWFSEDFGNAHSAHAWGQKANAAVMRSRMAIAKACGVDPMQVIFTSGATEANNWAMLNAQRPAFSPFEHSAVREPALARGGKPLGNHGWSLEPPGEDADWCGVMVICNETGAILEPPTCSVPLHRDATQAVGKMCIAEEPGDTFAISGHKCFGPKGVGALIYRGDIPPAPMIRGGGQELGVRGGTLNVPAIVGFGHAVCLAIEEAPARLAQATELRSVLLAELEGLADFHLNDAPRQSPFIVSISFAGIEGATLVLDADFEGYGISSGPACSSGVTKASPVLLALGLSDDLARGTIRISFCPWNTKEAAAGLGKALRRTLERHRSRGR